MPGPVERGGYEPRGDGPAGRRVGWWPGLGGGASAGGADITERLVAARGAGPLRPVLARGDGK